MNLFITNREIINEGKPNERIRKDGREKAGDNLRYGQYHLDKNHFELFPEPNERADIAYDNVGNKSPEELMGSARFFTLLYHELCKPGRQDVLFFVHGFNTDLKGVEQNFEALNRRYVDNPKSPVKHIVIFTWPGKSPEIPLHYRDDARDAERSGLALSRAIDRLREFFQYFLNNSNHQPCGQKIHLMLHSMGHRVFQHMIREHIKGHRTGLQPFSEIFCMAGDVVYNIFEKEYEFHALLDFGERVHVYYHEKDRVLDISKYTKNFANMLGRYGRKEKSSSQTYVIDVQVTGTKDDPGSGIRAEHMNHWYYYTSTAVVDDVISIMDLGDGYQSKGAERILKS